MNIVDLSRAALSSSSISGFTRTYRKNWFTNPDLARQPSYQDHLQQANESGQCLFCRPTPRDIDGCVIEGGLMGVYENKFPHTKALQIGGDNYGWNKPVTKHLLSFGVGLHIEGFEQLPLYEIDNWWRLMHTISEGKGSQLDQQRTVWYSKEGQPDANAATVCHLHSQSISVQSDTSLIPIINCCLTSEGQQLVAPLMASGEDDGRGLGVNLYTQQDYEKFDKDFYQWSIQIATGDSDLPFHAAWKFTQRSERICSFTELGKDLQQLHTLFQAATYATQGAHCPGGVFTIYHKDGEPQGPLEASYFWLKEARPMVLLG